MKETIYRLIEGVAIFLVIGVIGYLFILMGVALQ